MEYMRHSSRDTSLKFLAKFPKMFAFGSTCHSKTASTTEFFHLSWWVFPPQYSVGGSYDVPPTWWKWSHERLSRHWGLNYLTLIPSGWTSAFTWPNLKTTRDEGNSSRLCWYLRTESVCVCRRQVGSVAQGLNILSLLKDHDFAIKI